MEDTTFKGKGRFETTYKDKGQDWRRAAHDGGWRRATAVGSAATTAAGGCFSRGDKIGGREMRERKNFVGMAKLKKKKWFF